MKHKQCLFSSSFSKAFIGAAWSDVKWWMMHMPRIICNVYSHTKKNERIVGHKIVAIIILSSNIKMYEHKRKKTWKWYKKRLKIC